MHKRVHMTLTVLNDTSHNKMSGLLPHHVDFIVPGVDAENGADADHVVLMVAKALDELVFDGDT